jgi:hypothetical protein
MGVGKVALSFVGVNGREERQLAETTEVQTCQATEAEASSQFRNDQAKLLDLQDRIARLDKALEQLGGTGK